MEIANRLQRTSLDHGCKPHTSCLKKCRPVKLNRGVPWGCGLNSAHDLFAIRRSRQGPQIVRHGDDGEQHRNQDEV
jgi:hypothetical protein